MQALYGTDITVEELREEVELEREALIEEFVDDALETYDEKEEQYGPELMREIERYVILQVVDSRWRSHLDSMDYLRDGIHLRAMAQKDPLVEYRAEGHAMFEELGGTIREEVVLTLFHAQVELERAGSSSREQGNGNLQYAARDRRRRRRDRRRGRRRGGGSVGDGVRVAGRRHGDGDGGRQRAQGRRPQRPLLVRLGQEVQEVPRRLSALVVWPPRLYDLFVSVTDPAIALRRRVSATSSTPRRRKRDDEKRPRRDWRASSPPPLPRARAASATRRIPSAAPTSSS